MSIVMKITASGQISIPAETRRKWNTDRVVVTETIDGLMIGEGGEVIALPNSFGRRHVIVDSRPGNER
jgi:bifunctional DNA-binding transcriptional regulator/antitoxin component of YhaV-PrlF toxin-antitoxin module